MTTEPKPHKPRRSTPKAAEASRQNGTLGGRNPEIASDVAQFNFRVAAADKGTFDALPLAERRKILQELRRTLSREVTERCII